MAIQPKIEDGRINSEEVGMKVGVYKASLVPSGSLDLPAQPPPQPHHLPPHQQSRQLPPNGINLENIWPP